MSERMVSDCCDSEINWEWSFYESCERPRCLACQRFAIGLHEKPCQPVEAKPECLGDACKYFHDTPASLCFYAGFLPNCGFALRKAKIEKLTNPEGIRLPVSNCIPPLIKGCEAEANHQHKELMAEALKKQAEEIFKELETPCAEKGRKTKDCSLCMGVLVAKYLKESYLAKKEVSNG